METYILSALFVGGALALVYRGSSLVAWTAMVFVAAAGHWFGDE
ncbi:MAG: hypothetical protein OEV69_12665 [Gammaproteobacteria bacterium]|jgi:hypothetical protein|nr:hypothetical protein [Gammaproteobacteria bacterium]MDH4126476.1 hypothetical protein [Gammaproteobacteria bacterium]MDH5322946.1 hypothetical protein [Gammaproteobacteria bacterium]